MKIFSPLSLTLFISFFAPFCLAADPVLQPAWQTDDIFLQPESIVYDAKRGVLYVSNVNGDDNGFISLLSPAGELIDLHWLTGLNGPKGLALVGDNLYVADVNDLLEIDVSTKKITQRYHAPGSLFLNDVAADDDGNVYVSDMMANGIYRLADGELEIWLVASELEAPNGLLIEGNQMIVGSWGNMTDGFSTEIPGHLKTIELDTKELNSLGNKRPVGNLDGVEPDGNGNYLVTDWMAGKLLIITPDGRSTTLLSLDKGSADHTVLPQQNLIIIPMMLSNTVVAYHIN